MKLIFLIILLCGITTTPSLKTNVVKAKKTCIGHVKATTTKARAANLDIVPSGLLFQF